MPPLQVLEDDRVGDRKKRPVRTLAAAHPTFIADAPLPLMRASGGVALLAGAGVAPAARIDVLPPAEDRAEELDLGSRRKGFRGAGGVRLDRCRTCDGGPSCGGLQSALQRPDSLSDLDLGVAQLLEPHALAFECGSEGLSVHVDIGRVPGG